MNCLTMAFSRGREGKTRGIHRPYVWGKKRFRTFDGMFRTGMVLEHHRYVFEPYTKEV